MNVNRIIIAADAYKADAETIGGVENYLSIQLTTNATGEAPTTHWATSGMLPQEQVALFAAEPAKFIVADTDLSIPTFLSVCAVHGLYRRAFSEEA